MLLITGKEDYKAVWEYFSKQKYMPKPRKAIMLE